MKKYALCISGLPYGFKECSNSIIKNIIEPNDCDVFIHGWHNSEQEGELYRPNTKYYRRVPKDPTDEICRIYNPKIALIERQINFNTERYESAYQPKWSLFRTMSMFYTIMQSNRFKIIYEGLNSYKYLGVARIRFDLQIKAPIKFDHLNPSFINVRQDCKHTDFCCNDHFAFSSSANMDIYSDTFQEIDKMYDAKCPYCAEILLGQHLKNNHLKLSDAGIQYNQLDE
ncbi:MAG TPA: hypothetical protein PLD02_03980 [Saprospiraceae bacterium]|nr:hypothetical protein [Saprospiraceae bacterium]